LVELDLFMDVHSVAGGIDPGPTAPRNRICRICATEIFLWGLRDWWVRERKKGFLEGDIIKRPDCPDGSSCTRQKDYSHAKQFNHIIASIEASTQPPADADSQSALSSEAQPRAYNSPREEPVFSSSAPQISRAFVDIPFLPPMPSTFSDPSSQDFRDEVDALL